MAPKASLTSYVTPLFSLWLWQISDNVVWFVFLSALSSLPPSSSSFSPFFSLSLSLWLPRRKDILFFLARPQDPVAYDEHIQGQGPRMQPSPQSF